MKTVSYVVAAALSWVVLQGCGSGGRTESGNVEVPAVTVIQAATDKGPLTAKISFILNSDVIAAKEVYGLRFRFALPEGLEPAIIPNPLYPQSDTMELDRSQIKLTGACSGAIAMGSFRRSDRKVEVALIDADGLEAMGTALGTIGFTATASDLSSTAVGPEGVVLEEVIGLERQLPLENFTLSAGRTND